MLTTTALILAILYGYGLSFSMHTQNFVSAVLFNICPFIMATFALVALVMLNLEWLATLV